MRSESVQNTRLTMLEGWLSIAGNTLLFAAKLWVGLVTGSVALTADAWHTLTDSISSGIVIFSAWVSRKPADEEHPFGHGRTDLICSVIIGVLLAMVGLEFFTKSIGYLRDGKSVEFGAFAIIVMLLSIAVKEAMAQFAFWAGRKTGNPILRAEGWHHRTDALSSVAVLVGILFSGYFWWVDGVLGIGIAVLICYAAYEILRDSTNRLIGERPDQGLRDDVEAVLDELKVDVQPHHFHLHRYGDHIELTFHIMLAADIPVGQAHDVTDRIEVALRERLGIEATIHVDPLED